MGAGTAGSVLAERLTASGRNTVQLIEAGGKPTSMFVKMPAGFSKLFKSKFDWALQSEPQVAVGGRVVFVPRGRMLGGSSNMNAQIHHWCHPADFEEWVAAGAVGWGWRDVVPAFREQECWLGRETDRPRGRKGAMTISPNRRVHPLTNLFLASARAAGVALLADYNGGPYEGVALCQIAHKDGQRYSAYDAFLAPARSRKNLSLVTHAQAVRIEFDGRRATGVVVSRAGAEHTYHATRGVILAAGAFGSPQLLMLSGIGAGAALQRVGIAVRRDTPEVGANLQDHPMVGAGFRVKRKDTYASAETPLNLLRYIFLRRGMLTSNAVEAFAFARTRPDVSNAPDLELLFVPFEWRNEGLDAPRIHAFSIASIATAPRSRGSVSLKSADPLAPPAIDFGLLTDPDGDDEAVLLAGFRLIRKIAATPPLAAECIDELEPGAQVTSTQDLRAFINTRLQTVYHPTSTCRMGSDDASVVDARLRVRGVEGLWVADASVMPTVPRGHPNAVVAMIAHRAAEMIQN